MISELGRVGLWSVPHCVLMGRGGCRVSQRSAVSWPRGWGGADHAATRTLSLRPPGRGRDGLTSRARRAGPSVGYVTAEAPWRPPRPSRPALVWLWPPLPPPLYISWASPPRLRGGRPPSNLRVCQKGKTRKEVDPSCPSLTSGRGPGVLANRNAGWESHGRAALP